MTVIRINYVEVSKLKGSYKTIILYKEPVNLIFIVNFTTFDLTSNFIFLGTVSASYLKTLNVLHIYIQIEDKN